MDSAKPYSNKQQLELEYSNNEKQSYLYFNQFSSSNINIL